MVAMTYGGILETTKILESIVRAILKLVKTTGHLISTTVGTSVVTNLLACGAFMFATLGVHSLSYAPFAFFCFASPIIAIIYGHFGWKITYVEKTERTLGESAHQEMKLESV
ncbi:hypothetical protein KDJ56_13095 [Brevibacillus composti]|uniref:Na+/H+ antiporter NhaC-like C-terminal domain-containing protein n=1 Tax=Brevibacillus composti TaxID=2796470 RepID=A0A7T5JMA1_9BACL|nr:Na+/H+ antiporter NhaC family protein [Brevibacillus composti]QQE72887.1 hypothetical protein JD108_13150 [Brevibacillus composti]QUO39965.1 hypothetical protein KDJ56_13095 [Brevibacillus composti]